MDQQIFSDGIGSVTIIGGTVRLDLVTFSPSEKDAKGQPVAVFSQRIVMGIDGFMRAAEKIQETAQTLARLAQRSAAPPEARPENTEPVAPPLAAQAPPPAAAPKRPFP